MITDLLRSKVVEYQKSNDTQRLDLMRFFLSQIKNKEIELRPKGEEVTDEIIFKLLKKLIKQRNENVELYKKAGREDGVERETKELEVLNEFVLFFPPEYAKEQPSYQNPNHK